MGEGGLKNPGKLPMLFMDGPQPKKSPYIEYVL